MLAERGPGSDSLPLLHHVILFIFGGVQDDVHHSPVDARPRNFNSVDHKHTAHYSKFWHGPRTRTAHGHMESAVIRCARPPRRRNREPELTTAFGRSVTRGVHRRRRAWSYALRACIQL
jgi:hypothetical protein